MAKVNWEAAERDYVERRATGESLSLRAYAEELGVNKSTILRHAKKGAWESKVEARSQELDAAVWDHLEIDQIAIRKGLLQAYLHYSRTQARIARLVEGAVMEIIDGDPDADLTDVERAEMIERLPMEKLRKLQQITADLAEMGGGLPKIHVVSRDDYHDEIVSNRRQLQEMEGKVKQLRDWARARRRGPYRNLPPDEDITDVEPIEPKALPPGRLRRRKGGRGR